MVASATVVIGKVPVLLATAKEPEVAEKSAAAVVPLTIIQNIVPVG